MKRFIISMITMLLLTGFYVLPASAAGSGSLSMGSASGKQGDTVSVPISITNNPGLISLKFTVSWGSNLELISVSNNGLLGGWTTPSPSISSPYTIRWADSLAQANNTRTGKIVTLNFRIKSTAPIGKETVSLSFQESRDVDGGKNSFGGASATISISCGSHKYGAYSNVNGSSHKRTCSACGYIETTGHAWNGGSVTKAASCKETGTKKFTCTACGTTKTETIAKTEQHSYGAWKETKKADCTKAGSKTHTCSVCSKVETESIKALGHDFKNPTIVKEATTTETGLKEGKCKRCGEVTQEVIPMIVETPPEVEMPEEPEEPTPDVPSEDVQEPEEPDMNTDETEDVMKEDTKKEPKKYSFTLGTIVLTHFGAMILGAGIMLGAMKLYEKNKTFS